MIAGRKLLLADDSIAIQKVIDLTFTDEGMEVTTVGDGQDALEKLNQFRPDVVLADVFMPGVDGYELCKFIKQSEQFSGVPVMLLIGTFEPFDEAEAKRAGADDVVTKPFQSIRQLVSRVGSLLGSESAQKEEGTPSHSTLGLDQSESTASTPEVSDQPEHANVRVFIEAPVMSESQESVAGEHHCPPDIDLQTADTRKLEPIDAVPAGLATDDTLELEAVHVSYDREIPFEEVAAAEQNMSYQPAQNEAKKTFDDSVLDLGDVDNFAPAAAEDDFVLDLDGEAEAPAHALQPVASGSPSQVEAVPQEASASAVIPEIPAETSFADTQEWAIITPAVEPQNWEVKTEATAAPSQINAGELSPEAIEAISRRVVEHLSDKVVREIAWEVVPELSELLIKKRLDEQK